MHAYLSRYWVHCRGFICHGNCPLCPHSPWNIIWLLSNIIKIKCIKSATWKKAAWIFVGMHVWNAFLVISYENDNCPNIHGFMNCRGERKGKCKACRDSSGVVIYFWQDIRKGVQKVESTLKYAIWLRLYKNYFGLNKDLYLCIVYTPPRNSPTYVSDDGEDMDDTIAREIDIFWPLGHGAIIRDMNSRVGSIQ